MRRFLGLMILAIAMYGMAFVCGGCSGGPDEPGGFNWTQSPQFERDLSGRSILALDTIGARAGLGGAYAAKWSGRAEWSVPEGYSGALGPWTCNSCGYADYCVHAWTQYLGDYSAKFCFAGQPVDATVDHEWLHDVISEEATDAPEVLAANNGHPSHVHIRGTRYRVKDLTPNAIRWPSILNAIPSTVYGAGRLVNWGDDEWGIPGIICDPDGGMLMLQEAPDAAP